jgi:hypothetical protein
MVMAILSLVCVTSASRSCFPWPHGDWASSVTLATIVSTALAPVKVWPAPGLHLSIPLLSVCLLTLAVCWIALATAGRRTAEVRGRFFVDAIAVRQWQTGGASAMGEDLVTAAERAALIELESVTAGLEGHVLREQLRLAIAGTALLGLALLRAWNDMTATSGLEAMLGPGMVAAASHASATAAVLRTLSDPALAARQRLRTDRTMGWRAWAVAAARDSQQVAWVRWLPTWDLAASDLREAIGPPPGAAELPRMLASMPTSVAQAVALWPAAWRRPHVLADVLQRLDEESLPWWHLDRVCLALANSSASNLPPHEIARSSLMELAPQSVDPDPIVELPPWMEALLVDASRSPTGEIPHKLVADTLQWLDHHHPIIDGHAAAILVAQSARGNLARALRSAGSPRAVLGRQDRTRDGGTPKAPVSGARGIQGSPEAS